jgi:hypothetical protein
MTQKLGELINEQKNNTDSITESFQKQFEVLIDKQNKNTKSQN